MREEKIHELIGGAFGILFLIITVGTADMWVQSAYKEVILLSLGVLLGIGTINVFERLTKWIFKGD